MKNESRCSSPLKAIFPPTQQAYSLEPALDLGRLLPTKGPPSRSTIGLTTWPRSIDSIFMLPQPRMVQCESPTTPGQHAMVCWRRSRRLEIEMESHLER